MMGYVIGTQEPAGRTPHGESRNKLSKKINKEILDYNLQYKINIYKSILI